MRYFLMIVTTVLLISACDKDDKVDQSAIDEAIIQQYIEDHDLDLTRDSISGIYYKIIKPGYGGHPGYTSSVEVTYTGYLTNDTIFEKTSPGLTQVISLSSSNIITGWKYAVPMLQRGGKGMFIIPSELGFLNKDVTETRYDENKNPYQVVIIPANSVVIFEINLIDF